MKEMYEKALDKLIGEKIEDRFGKEKVLTVYPDYRDEMSPATVKKILESEDPEQTFDEKLFEVYMDYTDYDFRETMDHIIRSIEEDPKRIFGKDYRKITHVDYKEFIEEAEEYIMEALNEEVSIDYPYDHFREMKFKVPIIVDTGDGNADFTMNTIAPYYCGVDPENLDDKASLVWLAGTQGYSKSQLILALTGTQTNSEFLQSVRQEVENECSNMNMLTFLVSASLGDLMKINSVMKKRDSEGSRYDAALNPDCGTITISKETMTGLYDSWSGGGSLLEIKLEKDVELPIKYIHSALPDGSVGYGVDQVYGLCGYCWKETIEEVKTLDESVA